MPTGKRNRQDQEPTNPIGDTSSVRTRSSTAGERQAKLRKQLEDEKKKEQELEEERAEALRNQPRGQLGERGDGQFHMAFVRMGQGDCTIISTPAGQNIMIDCGSDATEAERFVAGRDDLTTQKEKDAAADKAYLQSVKDVVYGAKFLKGKKSLDFLILTHADTDHYNKLRKVLETDVSIYKVFHSDAVGNYSCDQVSSKLIWTNTPIKSNIFAVTVNETAKKLGEAAVNTGAGVNSLDDRGALRIHTEDNCAVYILAANVATDFVGDSSNLKNRGSVVTLIEVFGKKILICGDATRSTEHFIMSHYKEKLPLPLDLIQAPHHGSNVTSSQQTWADTLKSVGTVISAGKKVDKDHLPSLTVINRYTAHNGSAAKHELYYWEPGAWGAFLANSAFFEKKLYITGSLGGASALEITLAADSELTITANQ